jgi:hypothetical protein
MRQDTTSALSGLASLVRLQDLLTARSHEGSAEASMTCEAFEVDLGQAVRGLENELKAADLARDEVDAEAVMVDGKEWRKCLENQPKTSLSSSGPVTVARNLYRPADGGQCICPLELRAGISVGLDTPVLARQGSDMMGHMTSDETSKLFAALGIAGPSSSSGDRLPKRLSAVWESHREPWEDALRQQEVVPAEASVVAVSLDGVMVPDKDAQREAKATREAAQQQGWAQQLSGPAGYREVGCGTVTLQDEEANRLDTVRYGRAPEDKKQTLTEELEAELASMLAVRPDWEVVALAADDGEKSVEGCAQYERLRIMLRDQPGGADEVMAALSRLARKLGGKRNKQRRKRLNTALTDFKHHRDRMDYAASQVRGLPMGSGVVEAACKTLATQRLKRSGMSWRDGKLAMLTMRSLQQSHRWAAAWALLSAHFRVEVIEVRKHGHLRELTFAQKAA